jgi:RNA polymerase sigma-70 factor, ECF subfamily
MNTRRGPWATADTEPPSGSQQLRGDGNLLRTVHISGRSTLCTGELVEEGDAFAELYTAVGQRLWRAVYVYTGGHREMTDDVVAEAFVRTLERGDSVRDRSSYVYRVAFRLAAFELRRPATVAEVPEKGSVTTDGYLEGLFGALRQLSPRQRAAIYLRYQADLPVDEVARLMGSSSTAVRVHLMRGRRRLAELLPEVDDA